MNNVANMKCKERGCTGIHRKAAGAFTLIELLVVIAVITILMGLSFPALQRAITRSRISRAQTEVRTLQQAWLSYWNTYGELPVTIDEMNPAVVALLGGDNPNGIVFMEFASRHFTDGFRDPWGNYYRVDLEVEDFAGAEWVYETRVFLGHAAREKY